MGLRWLSRGVVLISWREGGGRGEREARSLALAFGIQRSAGEGQPAWNRDLGRATYRQSFLARRGKKTGKTVPVTVLCFVACRGRWKRRRVSTLAGGRLDGEEKRQACEGVGLGGGRPEEGGVGGGFFFTLWPARGFGIETFDVMCSASCLARTGACFLVSRSIK